MTKYHFRIRFLLQGHTSLTHEESSFEIRSSSKHESYVLEGLGTNSINKSQWLILENGGEGFSTEEEAADAAFRAKSALLWCSSQMRFGIDLGNDGELGGSGQSVKQFAKERGVRQLNDRHGILTYEEDPELPTTFISVRAAASVGKDISEFERHFNEAITGELRLSERDTLAFELYSLSHFETSPRARFITLVISIESLIEVSKRSSEALDHIEKLMEWTRYSDLPQPEEQSLVSKLGELKNETISKAGRKLMNTHLSENEYGGKSASTFFKHCYDIRSDLVHKGRTSDETTDLQSLVTDLDELVSDLLTARFIS